MTTARTSRRSNNRRSSSPLVVRLDQGSKSVLSRAAALRGVSISEYVRLVLVPQARREISAANEQTIALTPDEQLAFWKALHAPQRLTTAQRRLGRIMRS